MTALRVLDGARFTCHGDGLCCTDVHAIGPVLPSEEELLVALHPSTIEDHGGDRVLGFKEDGTCLFLDGGKACRLHAQLGALAKPAACRQYPMRFIETPTGTRVATSHMCPCRTMGERAPLDPATLEGFAPDRRITATIPLDADREVTMPEWEAIERELLPRVAAVGPDALGVRVRVDRAWQALGEGMAATDGDDRFATAIRAFAQALLDREAIERPPWRVSFDRAEARAEEGDPERILRDWVREEIWSLEWAFRGDWAAARIELATRAQMAARIADHWSGRGDRVMAEAVAVVELVGLDDDYQAFVAGLGRS